MNALYIIMCEGARIFSGRLNVTFYQLRYLVHGYNVYILPACSYQAACNFLEKNGLLSIIRAHEAQDAGLVLLLSLCY